MDSWFKKKNKKEVQNISSPLRTSSNSQAFQRIASLDENSFSQPKTTRTSVNTNKYIEDSDTTTINTSNTRYSETNSNLISNDSNLPQNEEVLNDSMDMKGEKRRHMRTMPPDSKWMMIKSQREREKQTSINRSEGKLGKQIPEFYIRKMKDYNANLMPIKNFEGLRISLTTETIGWVKQFIYLQGLRMLSDALAILNRKPSRKEFENMIESEIVRCIKATLNTGCGSKEALENPKIIYSLTFSIDSGNIITRKLVADALIYLCFSEDIIGHAYVIEGLDKLQKYRKYSQRFEGWLTSLENTLLGRGIMGSKVGASEEIKTKTISGVVDRDLIDYGLSNMMLVNALIEIPDEIDLRMSIRSQLNTCGLNRIIQILATFKSEHIDLQIRKYEIGAEEDMNEIVENYNSKLLKNTNDPDELFQTILKSLANIKAYDYFISILKHLILIKPDEDTKNKYYKTIESVVSDLIINNTRNQNIGEIGISGINANNALAKFEAVEELEKANNEIKELKEQVQIILKKKNQLEFESNRNQDESIFILQNRNKNLEKLVKMSKKTIEAMQKRYKELVAHINAATTAEGELKLKNIYSIMQEKYQNDQKEANIINEKQTLNSEITDIEIENQILRSGKGMKIVNNQIVIDEIQIKEEVKSLKGKLSFESEIAGRKESDLDYTPKSNLGKSINFEGAIKVNNSDVLNEKFNKESINNLSANDLNYSPLVFSPLSPQFSKDETQTKNETKDVPLSQSISSNNKFIPPLPPSLPDITLNKIPGPPPLPLDMKNINIIPSIPGPPPPPNSGNFSGTSPAPPLPPVKQMPQRKKLKIQSSVKLKQLQWDKLSYITIRNTIWEIIGKKDDEYINIMTQKENVFKSIEEKFCTKINETPSKHLRKLSADSDQENNTSKTLIIDPKRAYNINIMLGRYKKYKHSEIRNAILTIDESILTEVFVKQLLNFVPTEEESYLLAPYIENEGDYDSLGRAEVFMCEMLKIKRYENKLRIIHFKLTFTDAFNDLDQAITSVYEASNSLLNSKLFPTFFDIVLIIGNYMNGNGFRGGAYGFKISSLTKIKDTKYTNESKLNLMHFIVSVISNYYPELLNLLNEISSLNLACRVSFNDLIGEYKDMQTKIENAKQELTFMSENSNNQLETIFLEKISIFINKAEQNFILLEQNYKKMNISYSSIAVKLGEDPNAVSPDEFFGVFKQFLLTFEKCNKENKLELERQQRLERRKLEVDNERNNKAAETNPKSRDSSDISNNEESKKIDEDALGVMDNLLESLKNGGEFNRRKNKKLLKGSNTLARNSSVGIKALQMLDKMKNEA